jgi:hypothetical protein
MSLDEPLTDPSLFPLADPSQPQSMGGYLSTSNHVLGIDSSEVTLETDKPIYWSIEFGSPSASASLQQVRGGERTGAGAALGGSAAAAPYSPSDPFADQGNISSSSSQGRRDSRTTPYLPSRDSDPHHQSQHEPVESLGEDSAPPGPTVAETGEVIPSSPSGPGPLSGTLQPRRRSSAYRGGGGGGSSITPAVGMSPGQSYLGTAGGAPSLSPSLPARPPTQRLPSDYSTGAGAEGQGQGPVGNTTPAYLPPPHASPLTGSAGGRPEVLRVPSADFVSRGSGAGLEGGQGYGGSYGAAPPLDSAAGVGTSPMTAMEMDAGPVPGGFPSSSYPSSTSAGTAFEARTSGDGAAGGAGGVGLALASGISHHQSSITDTTTNDTGVGSGGGVRARIRRDGTITRRGVDSDFDQAESEQLPPYTEM